MALWFSISVIDDLMNLIRHFSVVSEVTEHWYKAHNWFLVPASSTIRKVENGLILSASDFIFILPVVSIIKQHMKVVILLKSHNNQSKTKQSSIVLFGSLWFYTGGLSLFPRGQRLHENTATFQYSVPDQTLAGTVVNNIPVPWRVNWDVKQCHLRPHGPCDCEVRDTDNFTATKLDHRPSDKHSVIF